MMISNIQLNESDFDSVEAKVASIYVRSARIERRKRE